MGDLSLLLTPIENDYSLITGSGVAFSGKGRLRNVFLHAVTNDTVFTIYMDSAGNRNKLISVPVKAGYFETLDFKGYLTADYGCYILSTQTDSESSVIYSSKKDGQDFS